MSGEYYRNTDILVEFDEVPDLFAFLRLEAEMEDLLNSKVDLVRKKSLRPQLRECILAEVVYV